MERMIVSQTSQGCCEDRKPMHINWLAHNLVLSAQLLAINLTIRNSTSRRRLWKRGSSFSHKSGYAIQPTAVYLSVAYALGFRRKKKKRFTLSDIFFTFLPSLLNKDALLGVRVWVTDWEWRMEAEFDWEQRLRLKSPYQALFQS